MTRVVYGSATAKAERTRRPTAVLTGMFCRFGSVDEIRPVLLPVCS